MKNDIFIILAIISFIIAFFCESVLFFFIFLILSAIFVLIELINPKLP